MHAEDVFYYGHQTVLNAAKAVPDEDRRQSGACGFWSPQDVIAHLTSFERLLIDILESLSSGRSTPLMEHFIQDHEGFNLSQVEQRSSMSWQEVLEEYEGYHKQARELLAGIPEEKRRQTGSLPWYGEEYDLEDFLAYASYGHKREHSAQLAAFRDVRAKETGRPA